MLVISLSLYIYIYVHNLMQVKATIVGKRCTFYGGDAIIPWPPGLSPARLGLHTIYLTHTCIYIYIYISHMYNITHVIIHIYIYMYDMLYSWRFGLNAYQPKKPPHIR